MLAVPLFQIVLCHRFNLYISRLNIFCFCFQLSVMSCNGFVVETLKTVMTPQRHKAIFLSPGDFEQITLSFNMKKSVCFCSSDIKQSNAVTISIIIAISCQWIGIRFYWGVSFDFLPSYPKSDSKPREHS